MANPDLDIAVRERFDQPAVAAEYVKRKNRLNTSKNRREMRCIENALEGIEENALILDLPTGTGRLIPMLLKRGFRVLAADYSEHMLNQARKYYTQGPFALSTKELARVEFLQLDIMNTLLPNGHVDVCVCNRLFHHYPTSALRQKALSELVRISKDRIILSYFSNHALSALRFHCKNRLLGRSPDDRVPIWPSEMARDVVASGAVVEQKYPVRYGFSPQTYLKLGHNNEL